MFRDKNYGLDKDLINTARSVVTEGIKIEERPDVPTVKADKGPHKTKPQDTPKRVQDKADKNEKEAMKESVVIAKFSKYLDENFHVDQLTEEEIQWIYENEFAQLNERVVIKTGINPDTGNLEKRVTSLLKKRTKILNSDKLAAQYDDIGSSNLKTPTFKSNRPSTPETNLNNNKTPLQKKIEAIRAKRPERLTSTLGVDPRFRERPSDRTKGMNLNNKPNTSDASDYERDKPNLSQTSSKDSPGEHGDPVTLATTQKPKQTTQKPRPATRTQRPTQRPRPATRKPARQSWAQRQHSNYSTGRSSIFTPES